MKYPENKKQLELVWIPYVLVDTNKPISTKWDKEVDASNFTQAKE
jgi:hypothetical protein